MNSIMMAGGAMLALNMLRRKLQRCPLPSFKDIIETVHYLPGRVRFYIPTLKGNRSLASTLEKQLASISTVKQVAINPALGTLLITFDSEEVPPIILMGGVMKLLGLEKKLDEPRYGRLRKKLRSGIKVANNSIFDATDGLFDFNSMLSLLLVGGAVFSLGGKLSNLTFPSAVTMSWWAFNRLTDTRAE